MTTEAGKLTITIDAKAAEELIEKVAAEMELQPYADVAVHRMEQDAQWGGPQNDDRNTAHDWLAHLGRQAALTHFEQCEGFDPGKFRERMVKIAALSIAAIEAVDRFNLRINRVDMRD